MNLPAAAERLREALEISRAMLAAAETADWETFASHEIRRRSLLQDNPSPFPDHPLVRESLETLLSINRRLEQVCGAARDQAAAQLQDQRRKSRAVRSYQEVEER
ncbi:MAG: hypothetical protein Kow006_24110 [Gammaproteobacteria bacterium]